MAKHHSPRALASLFDAASHLEPAVPLDLLVTWSASDQSEDAAQALLAEYAQEGTCMLGDASGLSRLSRELPLLDVLAMLHKPKSMVMTAAQRAGGQALNGWTADNTAVWFPASVAPAQVLACTEGLINSFTILPFQMSFGLHSGTFYKIGDTLLGDAYQTLEHIAENEVPAGKIWASSAFCARADVSGTVMLEEHGLSMMELACSGPSSLSFSDSRAAYPHPFDGAFFQLLDMYTRTTPSEADALRETLEQHAGRTGYVLFFAYKLQSTAGLAGVLARQLEDTLLCSRLASLPLGRGVELVKAGGGIGIAVAEDLDALLVLARQIGAVCAEEGMQVALGIDKGSYFLFHQEDGGRDVAGSPVNIASKLSEDKGEMGSVLISEAAWEGGEAARRRITVSGIEIAAMQLDLATL